VANRVLERFDKYLTWCPTFNATQPMINGYLYPITTHILSKSDINWIKSVALGSLQAFIKS